jgi:hypothetical protein
MANAVTTAGSLTCANNGKPTLTSTAKLTVSGKPVIPFSSLSSFTPYTGCTYNDGSGVTGPCTTTTVTTGGQASKLTVGGQAALLDNLSATAGTPPPPAPISVAAGQSKLTAS